MSECHFKKAILLSLSVKKEKKRNVRSRKPLDEAVENKVSVKSSYAFVFIFL